MCKKEQRNINFWITSFTNVFCFLSQRIYLAWKALAAIVVTKVIFISSSLLADVITLPGLCKCLYVYILSYLLDGCNTWNLKLRKKLFLSQYVVLSLSRSLSLSLYIYIYIYVIYIYIYITDANIVYQHYWIYKLVRNGWR